MRSPITQMIREGDRILLGVSGGKDSLSLLQILCHLQCYAPVRFELGVITVDPEVEGFDPASLKAYYDELGIAWFYAEQPIMAEAAQRMQGDSFCAYCARMKRGIMYTTCRREGYNVLALAQHLDDLAESLMMSIFHGGQLRTMKAHYLNDQGDIRIIRPLVYCRESQTAAFAKDGRSAGDSRQLPRLFQRTHPAGPYETVAGQGRATEQASVCEYPACHATLMKQSLPDWGSPS